MNNDDDKIDIKFNNREQATTPVEDNQKGTKERKKTSVAGIISAIVVAVVGGVLSYFFVFKKENGTLVCTMHQDSFDIEYTIKIKNKRYSSGKVRYTYNLNDLAKQYNTSIDELNLNNACSSVTKASNYIFTFGNCKEERKDDLYYVDVDLSYKSSSSELGEVKAVKNSLEKEGFSCK